MEKCGVCPESGWTFWTGQVHSCRGGSGTSERVLMGKFGGAKQCPDSSEVREPTEGQRADSRQG